MRAGAISTPPGHGSVETQPAPAAQELPGVPRHAPVPSHTSPVVHAIASLHVVPAAIATKSKRIAESLQFQRPHVAGGAGGTGTSRTMQPRASAVASAGAHRSVPVHHRPSLHTASLGTWLATPALHASIVHATPSPG